ncbi:methyltransferase, partial [Pseudomonas sp. BGM005]|nr:methyltransferase [Pseudomonas sp. BG5]
MDSTPAAWANADAYLADLLVGHDPDLEAALAAQRDAGLPAIEVAPVSGKLLN